MTRVASKYEPKARNRHTNIFFIAFRFDQIRVLLQLFDYCSNGDIFLELTSKLWLSVTNNLNDLVASMNNK